MTSQPKCRTPQTKKIWEKISQRLPPKTVATELGIDVKVVNSAIRIWRSAGHDIPSFKPVPWDATRKTLSVIIPNTKLLDLQDMADDRGVSVSILLGQAMLQVINDDLMESVLYGT